MVQLGSGMTGILTMGRRESLCLLNLRWSFCSIGFCSEQPAWPADMIKHCKGKCLATCCCYLLASHEFGSWEMNICIIKATHHGNSDWSFQWLGVTETLYFRQNFTCSKNEFYGQEFWQPFSIVLKFLVRGGDFYGWLLSSSERIVYFMCQLYLHCTGNSFWCTCVLCSVLLNTERLHCRLLRV